MANDVAAWIGLPAGYARCLAGMSSRRSTTRRLDCRRCRLKGRSTYACLLFAMLTPLCAQSGEPPASWIDPDTGHRVVRLTTEPGSASLYFNQNGYTAGGKRLVYTSPEGISVFDLATHKVKRVVQGSARLIDAGRKSQRIYYLRDGAAFSTDVDT